MAHHAQVVGNEQIGQAQSFLQFLQQVHDLGLNGDVQRRDRLIADDELGVKSQGPGNTNALPLSTGELVRVAVDEIRVQAHEGQ